VHRGRDNGGQQHVTLSLRAPLHCLCRVWPQAGAGGALHECMTLRRAQGQPRQGNDASRSKRMQHRQAAAAPSLALCHPGAAGAVPRCGAKTARHGGFVQCRGVSARTGPRRRMPSLQAGRAIRELAGPRPRTPVCLNWARLG